MVLLNQCLMCEYFINCLSSSFTYQLPAFPGGLLPSSINISIVLGFRLWVSSSGALEHCDV